MASTDPPIRAEAARLFAVAVAAVDPERLIRERLQRDGDSAIIHLDDANEVRWGLPLTIVGAGKPAARMAAGCVAALGAGLVRGIVVTADGCAADIPGIRVFAAGHPLPDARGVLAAEAILDAARDAQGGLLCLLGGGASSLLVRPRPPLSLADKIATTRLLLACGATITELNTVRKHLSLIKGGGLLRAAPADVVTLILSDVVGDCVATIGSGPCVADETTFADAWAVFERYELLADLPPAVLELVRSGLSGAVPETIKPSDRDARRSASCIIGNNRGALTAAAGAAQAAGWDVEVIASPLSGDTTVEARAFAAHLLSRRTARKCILVGGETTVQVKGRGRGGRNQEFALALAETLAGGDWHVLSAGTDGIDGPTDAAGAFVDGTTLRRGRDRGLEPSAALEMNDSYGFFSALGDLYRPGPTGTNVMDIKVAMHAGESRGHGAA